MDKGSGQPPAAKLGLSPTQVNILDQIQLYKELSVNKLSTALNLSPPTVSVAVRKMEENGYIRKSINNTDARVTNLTLTDKAIILHKQIEEYRLKKVRKPVFQYALGMDYQGKESFYVNLQFLERRDSNPSFLPVEELHLTREAGGDWVKTRGVMAEAVVNLHGDPGDLYLVLLFNWIDSNDPDLDQESYTTNLTYLLRRNLKLNAEYSFSRVAGGVTPNESRVILGVVSAF